MQAHNNFTATTCMQVNLCYTATPVKNWRILLEQRLIANVPLLTATSAFGISSAAFMQLMAAEIKSGCRIPNFGISPNVINYSQCKPSSNFKKIHPQLLE